MSVEPLQLSQPVDNTPRYTPTHPASQERSSNPHDIIVGLATRTGKRDPSDNEDAGLYNNGGRFSFCCVADGLGNLHGSALASRTAVQVFSDLMQGNGNNPDFQTRLASFWTETPQRINQQLLKINTPDARIATTFLSVTDLETEMACSYLGNGSIYRAVFGENNEVVSIEKVLTDSDTLRTHSIGNTGTTDTPKTIVVPKSEHGELWILASDGMRNLSTNIATNNDDKAIETVIKDLAEFCTSSSPKSQDEVDVKLLTYVQKCQLDDDATIGILYSKGRTIQRFNPKPPTPPQRFNPSNPV